MRVGRRSIAAGFYVLSILFAGCSSEGEPKAAATPAPTPQPAPTAPAPARPSPARGSPVGGPFADRLVPFGAFEFEDVPRPYARNQLAPLYAAVKDVARIRGATVARAVAPGKRPVTVTLAGVEPVGGNTTDNAFLAVVRSLGARSARPPQRAAGGQAYFFETPAPAHVYVSPVAVEPYLLLLVAIGDPQAPTETVVEQVLATNSSWPLSSTGTAPCLGS